VAGIQSPGLTASPAIAEYVRDILADEGLALEEKEDFREHVPCAPRFSAADPDQRERLVDGNPLFARVVCRCELVTEAEVQDAIDRGARTLDGIKFRTRAGMGRCQGGFCTPRCMKLLADRAGVPFHEITKRGGGSWMVAEMINDQHPRGGEGEEEPC
jgi:glycerol-3-phosphate dehydrogenase